MKKMHLKQNMFLIAFYFGVHQKMNHFENGCALSAAQGETERYSTVQK